MELPPSFLSFFFEIEKPSPSNLPRAQRPIELQTAVDETRYF